MSTRRRATRSRRRSSACSAPDRLIGSQTFPADRREGHAAASARQRRAVREGQGHAAPAHRLAVRGGHERSFALNGTRLRAAHSAQGVDGHDGRTRHDRSALDDAGTTTCTSRAVHVLSACRCRSGSHSATGAIRHRRPLRRAHISAIRHPDHRHRLGASHSRVAAADANARRGPRAATADSISVFTQPVLASPSVTDIFTTAATFIGGARAYGIDSVRFAPRDSGVRSIELVNLLASWRRIGSANTSRSIVLRALEEGSTPGEVSFFSMEGPVASRPRLRLHLRAATRLRDPVIMRSISSPRRFRCASPSGQRVRAGYVEHARLRISGGPAQHARARHRRRAGRDRSAVREQSRLDHVVRRVGALLPGGAGVSHAALGARRRRPPSRGIRSSSPPFPSRKRSCSA